MPKTAQKKPKGVKSNHQRQVPRWEVITFKDGESYSVLIPWLQSLPQGRHYYEASNRPSSALRTHSVEGKPLRYRVLITKVDTFVVFVSTTTGQQFLLNVKEQALANGARQ